VVASQAYGKLRPGTKGGSQDLPSRLHAQKTGEIAYKNGDTEEDFIDKGGRMLAVYVREYRGGPVRQIELPFRVPLTDKQTGETLDLPLDGYIDLLEADGTVVELKTSGKAFSRSRLLSTFN